MLAGVTRRADGHVTEARFRGAFPQAGPLRGDARVMLAPLTQRRMIVADRRQATAMEKATGRGSSLSHPIVSTKRRYWLSQESCSCSIPTCCHGC